MTTTYTLGGGQFSEEFVADMPTGDLLELFNTYADKPTKKFSDRKTAVRRVWALIQEKGTAQQPTAEPEDADGAEEPAELDDYSHEVGNEQEPCPNEAVKEPVVADKASARLLKLFEKLHTVRLDNIVDEFGVSERQARGMLDGLRAKGVPVVSLGRGQKAWRVE